MNHPLFIGRALSVMLIVIGLSSCAKPEQKPTAKITDALPTIVATVNGVKIERAKVVERVEQVQSMLAHQQHMAKMDQAASQDGGQPPNGAQSVPVSTSPTVHDPAHAQHDAEQEKTMVRNIINEMALEELKLQEVNRLGLSVSHQEIEESVKHIEKQAGSKEALEEELRQGHATVDQWRIQLRQALLFQRLAEQRRQALPVSDQEVSGYWSQHHETLSKLWHANRVDLVKDRIRDLIQQAHWPAAETEWHNELVRKARIWVDPAVRQLLAAPTDHTHPGQGGAGNPAPSPRG